MAGHPFVTLAFQRTDRRRGRIENRDAEPVHRVPETAEVRVIGDAVEHHAGRAVHQRTIDDIGMARDPADIGGAPEDVGRLRLEHPVERRGRPDGIACRSVDDTLGLAGRAGRIKDEQGILGVHHLRLAGRRQAFADGGIENVAPFLHRHVTARPRDDDAGGDGRDLQRFVDVALQWDFPAAAHTLVGGDDDTGITIGDAAGQALRREAAEADRMDGADARAGEHRRRCLGDHRHVDHHPIAAADSVAFHQVREPAGLFIEFSVGQGAAGAWLISLENDRRLVAAGRQLPVEAVDAEV